MTSLFHNFSYRVKVPFSLVLSILISGLVITGVLIARASKDLRADLYDNAQDVGSLLVNSLVPAIRHDDLWLAYQILNGAGEASEIARKRTLLVVDTDWRTFVSNHPREFPIQSNPSELDAEIARLLESLKLDAPLKPLMYEQGSDDSIYVVLPLIDDGIRVGLLVMGYPKDLLMPKLIGLYWRVTLTAFAMIALMIPIGWQIGKRMVAPLVHLSQSMAFIGSKPLTEIEYQLPDRRDEIGRLGRQFQMLLESLVEKERLETQVIASERLAAIGRVAAGVAHEINNPLGGMMNAINTFRRYGEADSLTEKTASMLERGLKQIRDTVSILLVQSKVATHSFTLRDFDDVRALLAPEAKNQGVLLAFNANLTEPLDLPSTPVRQILINLVLNAIQACQQGEQVTCRVDIDSRGISILTENPGEEIPAEKMGQLFEPFVHGDSGGQGLGLWVTYQIVQQLNGEIAVFSEQGITRFHINIPH